MTDRYHRMRVGCPRRSFGYRRRTAGRAPAWRSEGLGVAELSRRIGDGRSGHRVEEMTCGGLQPCPPPHVGGYDLGVHAVNQCAARSLPAHGWSSHDSKRWLRIVAIGLLMIRSSLSAAHAASEGAAPLDRATLDIWSAPYRGWHYYPEPIIPSDLKIPGYENFRNFDVPTVYQIPGQPGKWFMSYIGFNGQGYNSFVSESTNLLQWTHPRLAMGFGPTNEFDHGGCVIGAFLYESYALNAPRVLKQRDGKFWTLYGAYPRQGGYELRPGYEGVAVSEDGLTWRRAKQGPILAVQDPDCGDWEKDCIYQPWLVEQEGRFYNFYNAANGGTEQMGGATSTNLLDWKRYPGNPIVRVRPGGYDESFCSDGKVFRDGDHWVMFYFGVGKGGAHIMAAFSHDLQHWTSHPEPLYQAGGHPGGLDRQYAHKISLVHNPANNTSYLYYCAVGKAGTPGDRGRCIGLLTSRRLPAKPDR